MAKTKKLLEGTVAVNEQDLGTLLLCSMRYAIARHTYMPSDICRIINAHKNELSEANRQLLAKDILSELKYIDFWIEIEPDSINKKIKQEEAVKWIQLVEDLEKPKE